MKTIKVEKMARAEHSGDWHDKPLRWSVSGPDSEVQKFATKKDAAQYKRIRSVVDNQQDAMVAFVNRGEL